MKAHTLVVIGLLLVCGACAGFWYGMSYGKQIAFRMMRTETRADLDIAGEKGNKQLYEYLKSRYYYLSNRAGLRFRPKEGDYGPVDETLLNGFSAGKGPTSFKEEYSDYQRSLPKP